MSEDKINQNLLIRVDATNQNGTGHLMRCLALAQAWQERGGRAVFLSHCQYDLLRARIQDEGIDFISLKHIHPAPNDLKRTLFILNNLKNQNKKAKVWATIDGYYFDTGYQKAIRNAGYRLMVLDDTAHLPRYHADILTNQNINAEDLRYKCDADTLLLLGPKYVLLRREFLRQKSIKRNVPSKARNILITIGGMDSNNVTHKVIRALNHLEARDLEVKIVAGPANLNIDSIKKEIVNAPYKYDLLQNVKDMASLMTWADIAITAAGSTCWELAFMGVASLCIVTANNQENVANGLAKAGIINTLGWWKDMDIDAVSRILSNFFLDKEMRAKNILLGKQLIDGRGADNLVDIMIQY